MSLHDLHAPRGRPRRLVRHPAGAPRHRPHRSARPPDRADRRERLREVHPAPGDRRHRAVPRGGHRHDRSAGRPRRCSVRSQPSATDSRSVRCWPVPWLRCAGWSPRSSASPWRSSPTTRTRTPQSAYAAALDDAVLPRRLVGRPACRGGGRAARTGDARPGTPDRDPVGRRAHPAGAGDADDHPARLPAARRADQPPRRRRDRPARRRSCGTCPGSCCWPATTGCCWTTCAPTCSTSTRDRTGARDGRPGRPPLRRRLDGVRGAPCGRPAAVGGDVRRAAGGARPAPRGDPDRARRRSRTTDRRATTTSTSTASRAPGSSGPRRGARRTRNDGSGIAEREPGAQAAPGRCAFGPG